MIKTLMAGAMAAFACAAPAMAQDDEIDPKTVDLARLIACETYDVPTYNTVAFWLAGTEGADARRHFGMTEVKSPNFMLKQYRLARPVQVFGRSTSLIAFNSSGPMAVLDETDPHALAKALKIEPVIDVPAKFMGERVIAEKTETADGLTTQTRITLNVSTVTTHPGKTLAGCSYKIEVL
jgi:hypothetical protein